MIYNVADYLFETDSKYDIKIIVLEKKQNRALIKINIDFCGKKCPELVTIKWRTQGGGIYTRWNCMGEQNRRLYPNWEMNCNKSRSASGMPLQCYLGKDGKNKITVAVSDVKTPIHIKSGFIEESAEIAWELVLFSQKTGEISEYSTELMLNTECISYQESIEKVYKWWESFGYSDNYEPKDAFNPVYSTWYSYHQQVTPDALLAELKSASKLGIKTVIIDDGWQTDDNGRGYAYCGEWRTAKTKIPNMKSFVDQVHQMGIKIMLWFSVPYVGIYSDVFERFRDKLLDPDNNEHFVLDPRYPEVREYLVEAYEYAVMQWNIDGLKLDFIDSFQMTKSSKIFSAEMDTSSVEDGVCLLLDEIYERLTAINPDILIEFRQSYVGPVMLQYGNMIRAFDCPMDPVTNRVCTVNLRLTSGERAVHSDMIMWDMAEPVETAADKLINILFAVPQISVKINELSESHYKMLKYYLKFWNEYEDVIMKGKLEAESPEVNYSLVKSEKNGQMVAAAYTERVLHIEQVYAKLVFVNGTGKDKLYIENDGAETGCQCWVYTCTGEVIQSNNMVLKTGINEFQVPVSGMLLVKRLEDSRK